MSMNKKDFSVLESDFLKLDPSRVLSATGGKMIDAMFMSPPWGGSGYHTLSEYKLEHIFPDFD
jgi:hypothetical protein